MKSTKQILREYAEEIGFGDARFTLEDLIQSHRYLKSLNLESVETRMKIREEAYNIGYDEGFETFKNLNFSLADIKIMTIGEICNKIKENE